MLNQPYERFKVGDYVYVRKFGGGGWSLAQVEAPGDSYHHWNCEVRTRLVRSGVLRWISERTADIRHLTLAERLAQRLNPQTRGPIYLPDVIARIAFAFDVEEVTPRDGFYRIYERGEEWPIATLQALEHDEDRVFMLFIRKSQTTRDQIALLASTATGTSIQVREGDVNLRVKRYVHPLVQLAAQAEELGKQEA